jgi:hypothetical protein
METSTVMERRCLLCQSKNLQYGDVNISSFRPNNKVFMLMGYPVYIYACLDCGTLGYHVDEDAIQDMRKAKEKDDKEF